MGWLKVSCGIKLEIEGKENIPKDGSPVLVIANHQSSPETFVLQSLFFPAVPILKKELLKIPFFGWGAWVSKPIAIDRGRPRQALAQMMEMGEARLTSGTSVIIYPEGTRNDYPTIGKFARGGAQLAKRSGVKVIPIAHNAGAIWPAHTLRKSSGVFKVIIGTAIETEEASVAEITQFARSWIMDQNI
jgi:1-acyl-sn-glycerol-3-phosphate acyltransferase